MKTTKRKAEGGKRTLTPAQERAVRAKIEADADAAHPLAMKLWEVAFNLYLRNPEALKVALRAREIYTASGSDEQGVTAGGRLIMELADAVTGAGGEEVMLSSPLSDFFPACFVKAVSEVGPEFPSYVELKNIVARVDAGEDLDALAQKKGGAKK